MSKKTRTENPSPKLYAYDKGSIDKISRYLQKQNLVPKEFRDTDKFVDIVSWNLRWFDHRDPERVKAITEIMSELNSDIFVLTEVAEDSALDQVIAQLEKKKAGYYSRAYGTTGGQQRVVLMWDRDWIRAKKDVVELFGGEDLQVIAEDGHKADVFPRLPMWGYFEVRPAELNSKKMGLNFELMGVHMKSQMAPRGVAVDRGGVGQRTKAAQRLAEWITNKSEHYDEDLIIAGDWNATPDEQEWKALDDLEASKEILFKSINPSGEVTHIARVNKSGPGGSRLDLHVINTPAHAAAVPKGEGVVIRWSLFEDLGAMDSATRQKLFGTFTHFISDHLPVLSRFYTVDTDGK